MFTKKNIGELLALASATLIADRFYHFHSFSLEFVAFLPTWGAIRYGGRAVIWLAFGKPEPEETGLQLHK